MMMPPKKSKAARESGAIADSQQNGTAGKLEEEQEEVNVFKVEILLDKRQRSLPASEQNYKVWIAENFEESDSEVKLSLSDVYECYRNMCTQSSTPAFETLTFYKMIRESFPKNFQLKEGSSYESLIKKKRKKSDKKKEPEDANKLKVNLKEVLETTINEFGNPTRGIRFSQLKTRVASKYPSLNMDQKPQFLMMVLNRGIRNRFLECVRGIGRCGFYRMLGPPTPEEQEREEKLKKLKKEKGVKKEEQKEEGAGDAGTSGAEGDEENKEEKKDEEKEGEEPEQEQKKPRGRGKSKAKGAAGKKPAAKGKKKKAAAKVYRSYIIHSDPQRIEDTFPLAMTYMCEPKEASAKKIQRYIENYYQSDISMEKFRKALDTGLEKGFWDQISGSGLTGKYRLDIDEFDPTDDDDLIGQIVNAIVACTEPKTCSSNLLKRYLLEYHEDFNIAKRPDLYKRSLERGIKKNLIKQISGIGSAGSFQLAEDFTPSPTVLHGDDTNSDYFEPDVGDEARALPEYQMDISQFRDAYVPRPSKRRGHARAGAVLDIEKTQIMVAPPKKRRRQLKQRGPLREARSRIYDEDSSSEEEDETSEEENSEDEVISTKKTARGRALAKKATPKRAAPKKAAPKRAAPKRAAPKKAAGRKRAAPASSSSGRSARSPRKSYTEDSDADDEEEVAAAPTKGRSPRKVYAEASDSEEEKRMSGESESEGEVIPEKKSRSTPVKKAPAKGKKGKKGKGRRK